MSARNRLFVVMAALALFFLPFQTLQAQETTPEPDTAAATAVWEATEAWRWDSCCLQMDDPAAAYEAALAAGTTEAETLAAWCLEQDADSEGCAALQDEATVGQETATAALTCACVCALSSANCASCLENPSDPAFLSLPGVCRCIVAQ